MNHSNKDGTALAESEEGRLLIKENTLASGTFPTQSGCERRQLYAYIIAAKLYCLFNLDETGC
jgi:hypothetical protein